MPSSGWWFLCLPWVLRLASSPSLLLNFTFYRPYLLFALTLQAYLEEKMLECNCWPLAWKALAPETEAISVNGTFSAVQKYHKQHFQILQMKNKQFSRIWSLATQAASVAMRETGQRTSTAQCNASVSMLMSARCSATTTMTTITTIMILPRSLTTTSL